MSLPVSKPQQRSLILLTITSQPINGNNHLRTCTALMRDVKHNAGRLSKLPNFQLMNTTCPLFCTHAHYMTGILNDTLASRLTDTETKVSLVLCGPVNKANSNTTPTIYIQRHPIGKECKTRWLGLIESWLPHSATYFLPTTCRYIHWWLVIIYTACYIRTCIFDVVLPGQMNQCMW